MSRTVGVERQYKAMVKRKPIAHTAGWRKVVNGMQCVCVKLECTVGMKLEGSKGRAWQSAL